jgi:AcrR family transcriptional regulator
VISDRYQHFKDKEPRAFRDEQAEPFVTSKPTKPGMPTGPTIAGGFDSSHLQTRYRLLDAAARQIASNGFAGTSVRRIAAEAGVTSGAIYSHFPGGKEELYAEILKFVAETVREYIAENLPASQGDALEAIVHPCALCWDLFARYPSYASLAVREGISGNQGKGSPYLQENMATIGVLKRMLEAAQRSGAIREISASHFLFWVGTYCMSFHGASALRDSIWPVEEQASAREQYLNAVREMLVPLASPKSS